MAAPLADGEASVMVGDMVDANAALGSLCSTPHGPKRKRSRRAERAAVLTSSPVKMMIEGKQRKVTTKKNTRRLKAKKGAASGSMPAGTDNDVNCIICGMRFLMSCEEWIQCAICSGWACVPCTDANDVGESYTCDLCRD